MIGKLFEDLAGIAGDVATVVITPVAVSAAVVREITKPVADAAKDVADAAVECLPLRDGMTGR